MVSLEAEMEEKDFNILDMYLSIFGSAHWFVIVSIELLL